MVDPCTRVVFVDVDGDGDGDGVGQVTVHPSPQSSRTNVPSPWSSWWGPLRAAEEAIDDLDASGMRHRISAKAAADPAS
jgi:hypothetical protein